MVLQGPGATKCWISGHYAILCEYLLFSLSSDEINAGKMDTTRGTQPLGIIQLLGLLVPALALVEACKSLVDFITSLVGLDSHFGLGIIFPAKIGYQDQ